MAATFGPQGRNPDYARGEHDWCHIEGAVTDEVLSRGNGKIHSIVVGVAGTLLTLKEDGTTIFVLDTSVVSTGPLVLDIAISGELTATTTGAGTKLTISYHGRPGPTRTVLRTI